MHKSKAIHELKTIIEEHANEGETVEGGGEESESDGNLAQSIRREDDDTQQDDTEDQDMFRGTDELELMIKERSEENILITRRQSEALLDSIEICDEKRKHKMPTIEAKRGATSLTMIQSKDIQRETLHEELSSAVTSDQAEEVMMSYGLMKRSATFSVRTCIGQETYKRYDKQRVQPENYKPDIREVFKTEIDSLGKKEKSKREVTCDVPYMDDQPGDMDKVKKQTYHELVEAIFMANQKKCKDKTPKELQPIKKRENLSINDDELEKVKKEPVELKTDGDTKVAKGLQEELPSTSGLWQQKVRDILKQMKRKTNNTCEEQTEKHETKPEGLITSEQEVCPEEEEDIPEKQEDIPKKKEEKQECELEKVEKLETPPVKKEIKWKDAEFDYMQSACSRLTGQLRITKCRKKGNFLLHPATDEKEDKSLDVASQADSDEEDEPEDDQQPAVKCECSLVLAKESKKKMKQEEKQFKKKQSKEKRDKSKSRKEKELQDQQDLECCQTNKDINDLKNDQGKLNGKEKRRKRQKVKETRPKQRQTELRDKLDSPQQSGKQHETREFGQMSEQQKYEIPEYMEMDECVYTGLFEDRKRRVDLVIVVTESERHAKMKFDLLMGLVQMGIQLEFEAGELPSSDMFVKLHAPDDVLDKYAGILEVRKYFRAAHENLFSDKKSFLGSLFKLKHESEWLKSVRSRHVAPLRYSNQERSYIVYMMLRHQCAVLSYELERLMFLGILLDVFALHDGPYYCPEQKNFWIYNCRQVLFFNWAGCRNMFKYQPMHMVNEYFGSKLAFYFVFYGFYNKALIFASFWGIFMTVIYQVKDIEFFKGIREYGCGANFRHRRWLAQNATWSTHRHTLLDEEHSQGNFLCEGEQLPTVCHMVILEDLCIGMHVRRFTESPYMILFSAGIAFWALLFLTFWKRTERYWMWMWEENLFPKHQLFRTVSEIQLSRHLNRKDQKCTGKKHMINGFIGFWAIIMLLLILFIGIIYAHVEWLKPLTVEMKELDDDISKSLGQVLVVPEVNEMFDLALLMLLAFVMLILLFVLEKIFHSAAYISTTQFEKYITYDRFEKSLVSKYFFYSFLYTSSLVIYFTWLKGTFHNGILDVWYATFNVTTPWATYVIATPNISKYVTHVIRRAVTMNCGQFSCFNEGVIVFVITLLFREVIVRIIEMIKRNRTKKKIKTKKTMTTCEREYHLKPVTERQVVNDFNTLFIQLALVTLFAPMFPLAPLLALMVNMFDMRNKASIYTMHTRRALLFRSAGIGYWNHILKLICYAAPLFHVSVLNEVVPLPDLRTFLMLGLCIARTEIFKMYIYYKYQKEFFSEYVYIWKGFITTTLAINIRKSIAMMHHSGFYEANKYRVYSEHNETYVFRKTEFHPDLGTYHHFSADVARVDGFYDQIKDEIADDWPNQWNFVGENYSLNAPHPAHYHIKLLRVAFIVSYVLVFAALSVLVWQLVRGCPGRVARRLQRECVLRRLHQHRLTHLRQRTPHTSA